jgi:hypothetical protein
MLNHPGVICSVELPSRKDLCLVNDPFGLSSERLKEKKKLQLDYLHQMNPQFFFLQQHNERFAQGNNLVFLSSYLCRKRYKSA